MSKPHCNVITDEQQDGFIELARQIATLASAETKSHGALTKRVLDLETALSASRKELADLRVKNDRLVKQLAANEVTTPARELAEGGSTYPGAGGR